MDTDFPKGVRLAEGLYYRETTRAGPFFVDDVGRLRRPALSITPSDVFRLTKSHPNQDPILVRAGPVDLIYLSGLNRQISTRFLLLYDLDRVPVVGVDEPVWMEPLSASAKFMLDFTAAPMPFATGLAFAFMGGDPEAQGSMADGDIQAFNIAYAQG